MVLIFLRSLVFNVLFYALLIFWLLIAIPTFLMPRQAILAIARWWAQSSIVLMRIVCGTRVEFRGTEKIPQGPLIVASKHQSMWETFALMPFFPQPLYILKRELKWIPFFGWYLLKAEMIDVAREAGARTLRDMTRRAGAAVREGRQLIIFPEGTRRPVEAPPRYKPGVFLVYKDSRRPLHAGGAELRPVLAAPQLHALSRHAGGRVPRSAAARPFARRIHRPHPRRH